LVAFRQGPQICATSCGVPHSTYHLDGRRHIAVGKNPGQHAGVRLLPTPDQLVGVEQLHVINLRNEDVHFSELSPFRPLRHRSKAHVWEIDSASMEPGPVYSFRIGVVGSGGRAALQAHINQILAEGGWLPVRTELFDNGIPAPWPYLLVLRATHGGVGFAPAPGGIAFSSDMAAPRDGQPLTLHFPKGMLGKYPPRTAAEFPPRGTPWTMCEAVIIVRSLETPTFVEVGDLSLAARPISDRLDDAHRFLLMINPWVETWCIRIDGKLVNKKVKTLIIPGMSVVVPLVSGPAGAGRHVHEHRGTTYYIACVGVSASISGKNEYHFRVWW
jgi:hypothetical protein